MDKIQKTSATTALGLAAIICTYYGVYLFYGANAPLADDYYDCLYYLLKFGDSSSWPERISSVLWQHNRHIHMMDKIVYQLLLTLFGRIDFFWTIFAASLQLLIIPWIVWQLVKPEKTQRPYLILIPFFCFLNLGLWRPGYWAIGSIATLSSVTFTVAISLLLHKKGKVPLFFAIIFAGLLTFSYGNGILILMVGGMQILLEKRDPIDKKIWMLSACLILLAYAINFKTGDQIINDISPQEKTQTIIKELPLVPVGFFMLIGSALFTENDPAWPGVIVGAIIFLASLKICLRLWRTKSEVLYPVLTCFLYSYISFILISFGRFPFNGVSLAYDSNYKIYSFLILSITSIFVAEKIKNRKLLFVFIGMILLIPLQTSIRYFPIMAKELHERRQGLADWAVYGNRESLGFAGWPYLSEQILFSATNKKIYSPFDSHRGAMYQAKEIVEKDSCNSALDAPSISSKIINLPHAIAARVEINDDPQGFDSIMLCSNSKNYAIKSFDPNSKIIIFEKSKILAGEYNVYFFRSGKISGKSNIHLIISDAIKKPKCSPTWDLRAKITEQMEREFCKKVYQ